MAWKCPNCETLNQDPACVICGAQRPQEEPAAEETDHTDDHTDIDIDTHIHINDNRKKARTAIIVIIVGIIAIAVIAGVTAIALSSIGEDPRETQPVIQPDTETEPGAETEPATEPATEPVTEPATEPATEPVTEPATEPVTVTEPETEGPEPGEEITGVSLSVNLLDLVPGESAILSGSIRHTGTLSDNRVSWSSSNKKVATVSGGVVTAVGPGSAVITITTVNGKTDTCAVTVTEVPVSSVTLSAASVTLKTGEKYTLKATVLPANAADKELAWTTSDAAVVTCDNGRLEAVGEGSATITARSANGRSASCAVRVTAAEIPVTSVKLDENNRTVEAGERFTLSAAVSPADATDKSLTWTSSDKTVAECQDGVVTARKPGTATITATASNGKKATCRVTVTGIEAESVSLSHVKLTLEIGDMSTLTAVVNPPETSDKTLTWISGDEDIVSCDNGKLTAKAAGTVYIRVLTSNGKEAVCTVTVLGGDKPVESVTLNVDTLTLKPGDLYTFTAAVKPDDADNAGLTWLTDNAAVVSIVGNSGAVLAVREGSALITVTTANGLSDSCAVTVKEEATGNAESDFVWQRAGGGAEIVNYIGTAPVVVIPEMLGDVYVTSIGDSAFYNKAITSVTIPERVTRIGNFAFGYCAALGSVTLPEGVEIIGDYAFAACPMEQLVLPSTLVYIGEGAFAQCGRLSGLSAAPVNPYFTSTDGVLYNKDKTKLICFPAGVVKASALPATLTHIGSSAFFGCYNLSTIMIPPSVTVIDNLAFAYCGNLTSVGLPSGLTNIGADAFAYCSGLTEIIIPSTMTRIEERTFTGCSNLTSAVIPDNVTYIADDTFAGCPRLVITCSPGSYAEQYAADKEIPFDHGNP
ncbi:MAG: leucine-rich repeat protein [Eubacteriales bacterium]|nr:leucine-rich repeat protein [Eubacteriales bacterium]